MSEHDIRNMLKQLKLFLLSDTLRPLFRSYQRNYLESEMLCRYEESPALVKKRFELERKMAVSRCHLENVLSQIDASYVHTIVLYH